MKERRQKRERGDDARANPGKKSVLAAKLELGIALVVDARPVGHDVGVAAGATAQVAPTLTRP